MDIDAPRLVGRGIADESGNLLFRRIVPPSLAGQTLLFQAFELAGCEVSLVRVLALP